MNVFLQNMEERCNYFRWIDHPADARGESATNSLLQEIELEREINRNLTIALTIGRRIQTRLNGARDGLTEINKASLVHETRNQNIFCQLLIAVMILFLGIVIGGVL